MRKFVITGKYTEYIYAENGDEALEKFDEIMDEYAKEPFDEVEIEEMPLE